MKKSNKKNTAQNESAIKDDDVMISTSIKDLEKMLEGVEEHTTTKFEKMFLPALIVFALLALGGFLIIYSITSDMTRLANSMDPNMGKNMTSMTKSIENLSNNISGMSTNIVSMNNSFTEVNIKMGKIVAKLDNLDSISTNLASVKDDMKNLKPMLNNMNYMNISMSKMEKSILKMNRDISILRNSFAKPMNVINSIPFM